MMMISRIDALRLLELCDGEEIWSIDYCHRQRVPERWIREMRDAYESGFAHDSQTIFYGGQKVNQFEGVLAVDIALRVATVLGVDTARILERSMGRDAIVRAIKETVEEG
jgi:hypothetical protein